MFWTKKNNFNKNPFSFIWIVYNLGKGSWYKWIFFLLNKLIKTKQNNYKKKIEWIAEKSYEGKLAEHEKREGKIKIGGSQKKRSWKFIFFEQEIRRGINGIEIWISIN